MNRPIAAVRRPPGAVRGEGQWGRRRLLGTQREYVRDHGPGLLPLLEITGRCACGITKVTKVREL